MKNLLKLFCIYILLGFVSIIYLLVTKGIDIENLMSMIAGSYVEQNILQNFAFFFIKSIPSIVTVTICAIRMSNKNEGLLIRLVPLFLIVGLVLNAMTTFINLEDADETFFKVVTSIYNFIAYSNFFLLPLCILSNLNPNNQIAKVLKITGYVIVAIVAASILSLYIKIFLSNKVPTIYNYSAFEFQTVTESLGVTGKIVIISIIGEISAIMLGFMANYAFESETLESDVLDMDELMKQADRVAQEKQRELYARKEKKIEIDRSVSEKSGRMNVDNQLGAHSNVGVVNKDEQTESIIERALPSSSGPVINAQAPVPVMVAPPTPAPAPAPQVAVQQTQVATQQAAQQVQQVAQQTVQQTVQQPAQQVAQVTQQVAQQPVQQPPTNG